MSSVALVSYLQYLSLLGAALTDGKLLKAGLYGRYKVLFSFLIFLILSSVSSLLFDVSSQIYQKLWISTEVALWAFEILLVRELYRLILSKYQGLLSLGRWAMYFSVALAVVGSVASLLPRITPAMPQASRIMGYVLAAERGVDLSLALFLLLMLVFLTLYPVPAPAQRVGARGGLLGFLPEQHLRRAAAGHPRAAPERRNQSLLNRDFLALHVCVVPVSKRPRGGNAREPSLDFQRTRAAPPRTTGCH